MTSPLYSLLSAACLAGATLAFATAASGQIGGFPPKDIKLQPCTAPGTCVGDCEPGTCTSADCSCQQNIQGTCLGCVKGGG